MKRQNNHSINPYLSGTSHWSGLYPEPTHTTTNPHNHSNLQIRKCRHGSMSGRGLEAPQALSSIMPTFWFLKTTQAGPETDYHTKEKREKEKCQAKNHVGRRRRQKEGIERNDSRWRKKRERLSGLCPALSKDSTRKGIGLLLSPWHLICMHGFNQWAFLRYLCMLSPGIGPWQTQKELCSQALLLTSPGQSLLIWAYKSLSLLRIRCTNIHASAKEKVWTHPFPSFPPSVKGTLQARKE